MAIRSFGIAAALLMTSVLGGCSSFTVAAYDTSPENVAALHKLKGRRIRVGKFRAKEGDESEIECRSGDPIKTASGESFPEYIRDALIAELEEADVYSDGASVGLTGTVDTVDYSSGAWQIALTVRSSNSGSLHVEDKCSSSSGFFTESSCNDAAQSFGTCVQDILGKLVRNAKFKALVTAEAEDE